MTLPEGLEFLKFGWFVVHAIAFLLVYQFGYVRGRGDQKRETRQRELEASRLALAASWGSNHALFSRVVGTLEPVLEPPSFLSS